MLTTIREKTQGIIATFIIGLIIVPFALWGLNSYFDAGNRVIMATAGDIEITEREFNDALTNARNRERQRLSELLARQGQKEVPPALLAELDSEEFKKGVLMGLVRRALLRQATDSDGFGASSQQVAAIIRNMDEFKTDGKFDERLYFELLRQSNLTIDGFESQIRQQKIVDQTITGFGASAFVTPVDLDRVLALMLQSRRASIARFDVATIAPTIKLSEEELRSYYTDHESRFRVPVRLRIAHVTLSQQAVMARYRPSEQELEAVYAEEQGRFVTPARRRVSHVLITIDGETGSQADTKARKLAEDIAARGARGEDFAALARKHSADTETKTRGGDLGFVGMTSNVLPKTLVDAVNALDKNGAVSAVIRSEFGYHVVKLTAYTPAATKPLKLVRKQIEAIVIQRQASQQFHAAREEMSRLAYESGDSLGPIAKALNLQVQTSDWFTAAGGAGIASKPKIIAAAFAPEVLQDRRNSGLIESGPDSFTVIRVVAHEPARIRPFDNVRAVIERTLRAEKAAKLVAERGQALIAKIRSGMPYAEAARAASARLEDKAHFSRMAPKQDARLTGAVFDLIRPGAKDKATSVGGVALHDGSFAVIILHEVIDGNPQSIKPADRERILALLMQRRGQGYFGAYMSGVEKRLGFKVNDKRLERAKGGS